MNAVVCVIARTENQYINEWCHYYLDLGFSHIYLHDNNDITDPFVGDFIDKDILDKITIIDVRGQFGHRAQTDWYINFYETYKNTFDWCFFCDVDEFLFLNGECDNDINKFLSQEKFKNFDQIMIKWKMFGDDGVIERDMSIPVHKFFKINNDQREGALSYLGKVLVRGGLKELGFKSCHGNGYLHSCLPSGKAHPAIRYITGYNGETVFLHHYRTKTLKEFLESKFTRQMRIHDAPNMTVDGYFFKSNEWTQEKQDFADKWIAEHAQKD